eukprot:SM000038S14344  [mRNA]  locus=s38:330883:332218:- [translate_table: standard]
MDSAVRNLYSPDVAAGWGVHVVQEVKLLARKAERAAMDSAIREMEQAGMSSSALQRPEFCAQQAVAATECAMARATRLEEAGAESHLVPAAFRDAAAEAVFKERCVPVRDGPSWADYMSTSGRPTDEYDIVALQYTQEGLLSVDENSDGGAAAFGDDIAIECLATEYCREIYVMQAHGADGMVEPSSCLFFLPHSPQGGKDSVQHQPLFLFMKGTGWCGGGGDHYEPVVARPRPSSGVKAAAVL